MDVEKLKKINQLSVEFKKHGMAVSHDEAFAKASEVVRDDELKDVLAKTNAAEPAANASPTEKTSSGHSTSFDNQYQVMLERQNRQLVQEIIALKETVAMLKSDVEQLKSNAARPVIIQAPKQEKQAVLHEKKESNEKSHPKQGNYTSEDVAIEKMFYYGKK